MPTEFGSPLYKKNQADFDEDRTEAVDKYARMRPIFDDIAASSSATITPSAADEVLLRSEDMDCASLNFFWTVSA
jgi:hypothetical protein